MFFSGICDEAGKTLDKQIAAHKELGWSHLELRAKLGPGSDKNLSTLTDDEFKQVRDDLAAAGMQVSCYASKLGDWSRPVTGDFSLDTDDLKNALPRLNELNIPFVRCMSYVQGDVDQAAWKAGSIKRITELTKMAEDGGVTLVHENCTGWGGITWQNNLELLATVDSPALKVVFDTGNPPCHGQDAWEYYNQIKDHIVYIHIKDALRYGQGNHFTWCGEGDGCVRSVIADLVKTGYKGGVSIEPHLAAIVHTGQEGSSDEAMYSSYVEYGRRLMKIAEEAKTLK